MRKSNVHFCGYVLIDIEKVDMTNIIFDEFDVELF